VSSDDFRFGNFDDIVLEIQTSRAKFKCAIQHVNDARKTKLKIIDLARKIGKFSLLTFYNHYLKVKDVCEPFDLILYTNQKFDFKAEKEQIVLDTGTNTINVVMTKSEAHPWLSTNKNNCCYKFKIIENHDDSTKPKMYEEFFAKFYIYVQEMDVKQLEEHIFDTFKKEFFCEIEAFIKYFHFIESWKNRDGMKKKLSKTVMKNVLLFSLLKENIIPPIISKVPVKQKMIVLREAILKFDVTIFDKENEDLVKSIWAFDSNKLVNDEQAQELAVDYHFIFNDQTISKLLWLMDRYPLFVFDSIITRKAISLSSTKKFILFSDNYNVDDFTNLSVLRKLSDLEKHPEIYETIVGTFNCPVQPKTNEIPFGKFLQENIKTQEIVTTDKLVSMINDPLVISPDNEILPRFYMTRYISRNIIDAKFFEKMDEDTLVLISCWKKSSKLLDTFRTVDVEELLSNDEYGEESGRIIYVSESECSWEKFEECFSKMKKMKAHHFSMTEGEELEWVRSRHGVEDLQGFRVEQSSMEESELLKYENNINIVCAESGMGKTELMRSVKNKFCHDSWKEFIFPHYVEDKMIKMIIENSERPKKLIRNTESTIVRYLWDGLNTLSSENLKVIMKLIHDLSEEGSKHWITSRNILKQDLEEYFNTFSWTIKKFDKKQQKKYIDRKLSHLPDNLKMTSEHIIDKIRLSSCECILGIPLLINSTTNMLIELFNAKGSRSRHDLLTDGSVSIAKLYQYFVDKLYIHYQERHEYNPNNEQQYKRNKISKDERIRNYEKVAMKIYFEEELVRNKMDFDVDVFLADTDPYGFIIRVVDSNNPVFLHSSFSEYFAALYLAREDPQGEKFYISSAKYKNIVNFRNSILAASKNLN
jgi:hypothetical protein